MTDLITLVEIDYYDTTAGELKTLRLCDGLAYRTLPAETPANALYRPLLIDSGWSRVDIFSAPGRYGAVTPGEIVADDSDGRLSAALIAHAFDGRRVVQHIGERGADYSRSNGFNNSRVKHDILFAFVGLADSERISGCNPPPIHLQSPRNHNYPGQYEKTA